MQLFEDQVFCFTPKGDLKAFPAGATPVDFAYAIHSEVGDHCAAAKVNGRQVPLRTQLRNGDQVDISTAKTPRVTPEWDRFVVTGKARARIRRLVRVRQRDDFIRLGRSIVEAAVRESGHGYQERRLAPVAEARGLGSVEDLLAAVGEGRIRRREIAAHLHPCIPANPDERTVVSMERARRRREGAGASRPTLVRGLIPGLAMHFARCCHPIPGDRITGIVTTGKGVTIHTAECPTLESFAATPERWIEVDWGGEADGERPAHVGRMRLTLANEQGALAHVSALIAGNRANISNLRLTRRGQDFFEMLVDVEVDGSAHLQDIMATLRAQPEIASVERAGR